MQFCLGPVWSVSLCSLISRWMSVREEGEGEFECEKSESPSSGSLSVHEVTRCCSPVIRSIALSKTENTSSSTISK